MRSAIKGRRRRCKHLSKGFSWLTSGANADGTMDTASVRVRARDTEKHGPSRDTATVQKLVGRGVQEGVPRREITHFFTASLGSEARQTPLRKRILILMDQKHSRRIQIHSATPGKEDLSTLMLRPKSAKGRRRNSVQAPIQEEWLENVPNLQASVIEPPFFQPVLTSGSCSGQTDSLPPRGWPCMQQVRDNIYGQPWGNLKQPKLRFPSPPSHSPSLIPPTPSMLNRYSVLPSIRQRKEDNPPKEPLEP
ncbi:hypothetical protein SKAU_G00202360 [Synaphobranchus kaupii]|uniref:Uncharacterized protein n=1 Tax=Synaphobranchus kaupii TaxID=118154 RepID=A0A9Q1IW83_SYNKA|nr:hypothetical protein SKAU_G00202360 [Synaphobranchus kaupii]